MVNNMGKMKNSLIPLIISIMVICCRNKAVG